MEWETLVYRAISDGLVQAGNLDFLTEGGADFEGSPDEIVADSDSETDFTIGYHNNRPCLYNEANNRGYYVPSGFAYEQKHSGVAWQTITLSGSLGGADSILLP